MTKFCTIYYCFLWALLRGTTNASLCERMCGTMNTPFLCGIVCGNTAQELVSTRNTLRRTVLQLEVVENALEETNTLKRESQEALRLATTLLSDQNSTWVNTISELQQQLSSCDHEKDSCMSQILAIDQDLTDFRAHCHKKTQNISYELDTCNRRSQIILIDRVQIVSFTIVSSTILFLIVLIVCSS